MHISHSHQGKILSPDGSVAAYTDCSNAVVSEGVSFESTVRSSKCSLVVSASRHDYCRKYRSVLCAMHSHQKKGTPIALKGPLFQAI